MIKKHLKSTQKALEDAPGARHFKHPVAIPFSVAFFMIIAFSFWFLFYGGSTPSDKDVKRVELFVDGKNRTVPTRAETVGELLKRAGVKLLPEDVVEPGINSPILNDDFKVSVYKAKPVTVVDQNGKSVTAKIAETTPDDMAEAAGFKVFAEDDVRFAPPDEAQTEGVVGDLVTIRRSVPAAINLYGKDIKTRTLASNVDGFLKEKNIILGPQDKVLPSLSTKIKKNLKVFVLRPGQKIISEEQEIAPPVQTQYDATLDVGTTKVLKPGKPGIRIITYRIEVKKGKVVNKKEIQSVVSRDPEPKVIVEGTKTTGFSGSFDGALARLRSCEGSYSSNTGNGYYGAYQFDIGTWGGYGGYSNAAQAPPAVQDQKAWETYQSRGWSPWPTCSRSLGLQDIYR